VALVVTATATAYSFRHLDLPVAMAVAPVRGHIDFLGQGLASAILLGGEAIVFLALAIARIVRGSMSRLGKTVAAACVSSISAYAINASVLKVTFGVLPTGYVLTGWPHTINWFHGSPDASFPSGHMMLAGAWAGVMMRHYPKSILALAGALAGAGCLLILGNWHFVSDVLAGTFGGVTAGLLAAEIWLAHERSVAS
jgi:membrane-associated phospholipid phosphatase